MLFAVVFLTHPGSRGSCVSSFWLLRLSLRDCGLPMAKASHLAFLTQSHFLRELFSFLRSYRFSFIFFLHPARHSQPFLFEFDHQFVCFCPVPVVEFIRLPLSSCLLNRSSCFLPNLAQCAPLFSLSWAFILYRVLNVKVFPPPSVHY